MAARVSKLNLWLKHYLNETCSATFLNKFESAKKAGYKAKTDLCFRVIGSQNFKKLREKIEIWLDEEGMSENALKMKLVSLMNAKEIKFMKVKGFIKYDENDKNNATYGTSGFTFVDKEDERQYSDGETIVGIRVNSIETQRKTLDMALKVRGMNAPNKYEHTGKNGDPIETKMIVEFVDGEKEPREEPPEKEKD